jgi:hypothetical protein
MKNILIVGSGETSRANVEALMDDHYYANKELTVHLAIYGAPDEAQVWAAQYTLDKQRSVKVVATDGARFMGIPTDVPRTTSESPIREICSNTENLDAFLLWSDEDELCQNALAMCVEYGVKAFDLTNGLLPITPAEGVKEVIHPEVHKDELVDEIKEEVIEEDDDFDFDIPVTRSTKREPKKTPEVVEEAYEDSLYEGIHQIAKIFAEVFAVELKKVLGK